MDEERRHLLAETQRLIEAIYDHCARLQRATAGDPALLERSITLLQESVELLARLRGNTSTFSP